MSIANPIVTIFDFKLSRTILHYTLSFMKHLLFIAVFLINFPIMLTQACNCDGDGTISESVKLAEVIIYGKVISKTRTSNLGAIGVYIKGKVDTTSWVYNFYNAPSVVYTIKIYKVFKGKVISDTVSIITGYKGAACGVRFEEKDDVIIYGNPKDYVRSRTLSRQSNNGKTFWTSSCTRTDLYRESDEKEIIAALKAEPVKK
ncbi:hypothetical protein D3C78_1095910 [compost metagenome]